MVDYEMALCYGIIVSDDKMEEIKEALTDEVSDELMDTYSSCINSWTGGDYFVGVINDLPSTENDLVYRVSNFTIPADDDFKQFFTEHDLWKFIDWKPELLIINFCY